MEKLTYNPEINRTDENLYKNVLSSPVELQRAIARVYNSKVQLKVRQ